MKIITYAVLDIDRNIWIEEKSYDYVGEIAKCCGPSSQMENEAGSEESFGNTLQGNYGTLFGQQQGTIQNLNRALTPVLNAGPNQTGFSAPELASMNTQAIDAAAASNRNVAQAVGNELAGRGGSSGLESGVDQAIKGSVESGVANNLANTQNQIVQQNYATGRQNYDTALAGSEQLAGIENPADIGKLQESANANSFEESNKINDEKNQETADIVGGITSIAESPFTGGMSLAGLGKSLSGSGGDYGPSGSGAIPSDYTSGGGGGGADAGDDDFLSGGL